MDNSLFNLPKSMSQNNNNYNFHLSPESWIEENIQSIIQNDDTLNDSIKDLDSSM